MDYLPGCAFIYLYFHRCDSMYPSLQHLIGSLKHVIVVDDHCKSECLKILMHTVFKILLISNIKMDETKSVLEMWITNLCDSDMFGGIHPDKTRTEYEVC